MVALPQLLFFLSLLSAAVIAAPFYRLDNVDFKESAAQLVPNVPTQSPFSHSARHDSSDLPKPKPYYFPETILPERESEEQLTFLREAGFVKSSRPGINHEQQHESISTPDPVIGIAHSLPISNSNSNSHHSTTALSWENTPIQFRPLSFFAFAVLVACLATITRDFKNENDSDVTLKA